MQSLRQRDISPGLITGVREGGSPYSRSARLYGKGSLSISWMTFAWKDGPADSNERYVFLALADNANDEGQAFPSLPTIAEKTRLSESTVRRSIAALEKGGWLTVIRGRGAGIRSKYTLQKVSGRKVSQGKLSACEEKDVRLTEKRCQVDNSPTPPIRKNRQLTVIEPPSAGPQGEFMLASGLWEELGIAAMPNDVRSLAGVIAMEARTANTSAEEAQDFLLGAARRAQERGDVVNAFWFRDRRFTGNGNGNKRAAIEAERAEVIRRLEAEDDNQTG